MSSTNQKKANVPWSIPFLGKQSLYMLALKEPSPRPPLPCLLPSPPGSFFSSLSWSRRDLNSSRGWKITLERLTHKLQADGGCGPQALILSLVASFENDLNVLMPWKILFLMEQATMRSLLLLFIIWCQKSHTSTSSVKSHDSARWGWQEWTQGREDHGGPHCRLVFSESRPSRYSKKYSCNKRSYIHHLKDFHKVIGAFYLLRNWKKYKFQGQGDDWVDKAHCTHGW